MATAQVQEPNESETLSPAENSNPKHQHRVLLIEDSEDAKLLVQFALQEHGNGKY
jgi:hypothetical protein